MCSKLIFHVVASRMKRENILAEVDATTTTIHIAITRRKNTNSNFEWNLTNANRFE